MSKSVPTLDIRRYESDRRAFVAELGAAYRFAMRRDEAEAAFQNELAIDPHNALARYELGVLVVEKGDGARGRELIEAALREKPTSAAD